MHFLKILIHSLGHGAGVVIKIALLGMDLAQKLLYTNDSRFLFVVPVVWTCHVFGWTQKEEGLTAMERFPIRLQHAVVSLDRVASNLDCPSASLAFGFTWTEKEE